MPAKKPKRSKGGSTEAKASPLRPDEGSITIVGVGASAGGLEAFTELLAHLPLDTGMGFVLVQHLDPQHASALADLLRRATPLPVREATNKLRVEPNHVYVIPPNRALSINSGALVLRPRPQTRTPTRSIDAFFEALAEDQRERAIGVVLSGTASDGTIGLEAIKAEGGITFAQDDSARYNSMPRSAAAAGCVDFVLSPKQIAEELSRIARHPAVARAPAAALPSRADDARAAGALRGRAEAKGRGRRNEASARGSSSGFEKVMLLLRNHSNVDFSLYKPNTIERRIRRRMVLSRQDTLDDYARFLRGNARELDALYSDVLINVTSFFRNPDAFGALQRRVWPELLGQPGSDPVRIWVLGCSTGQEAYSLAMSFTEAADKAPRMRPLQVFATDLSDGTLDKARHGLYTKVMAEDVSPERLRRFFVEEEGGYRIVKSLRERVIFARHNVISDPPFSRIDLISCRNLLIYFEPVLQARVLPAFHYALKPGGYLYLGASESIGGFTDLFDPLDKKHKVYAKKPGPMPAFWLPVGRGSEEPHRGRGRTQAPKAAPPRAGDGEALGGFRGELTAQREADRITVNQFAPPAVLVNAELQVLQFRGPTSRYLEPPKGKASFDVLKMARKGLMLPLRSAIDEAKKRRLTARRQGVRLEHEDGPRGVDLAVIPLKNLRERCFLIVFGEADGARGAPGARAQKPVSRPQARDEGRRAADLEAELAETRDYLQSIQEQHEAANEELQASNEEVQSANEELQSINEELETSKEELESANEELTTVNEEMAARNAELHRLNADLVNIQTAAQQALVLLGRDLTIRRFSAQAERLLQLQAGDVGRLLGSIRHPLDVPDLEALVAGVIESVRAEEREVRDRDGRWFSLRVRPYLTLDKKVDGAVLALVDIDSLKRGEQEAALGRDYADNIIETVRGPLLVLDAALRVERASRSFYDTFRAAPGETVGRLVYELGNHQWDIPELRTLLDDVLMRGHVIDDFAVTHEFEALGRRTMLLNARRVRNPERGVERILLAIEDVTDRRQVEDELTASGRHKDEFLAMLAHELRGPLAPIRAAIEVMRRSGEAGAPAPKRDATPLDMLDRQVDHMVRLVDDLLEVNRIGRGMIELRRQRVELASVVGHAVEAARPFVDSREQRLMVTLPDTPVDLDADRTRLAQIVSNLLSNASKFTDPGGSIWLTAEREGRSGIVIRVRDTGIGIGAEDIPRIFELFAQAHASKDRVRAGLGIGLTLVRTLARLHGGDVEVASPGPGRGSEFVVRLPIALDATERPQRAAHESAEVAPPLRILVADDNADAAQSLVMLLRLRGHEAHEARDGLEAVEAAARLQPDVILLDLSMPGLSGYDAARKIREQQGKRRPLLVALSGWAQIEHRRRSTEAGFDAHIAKPAKGTALFETIEQARYR